MNVTEKITWEQVKELLPATTSLYYIDRNDSFDEQLDALQNRIQSGCSEEIDELIYGWWNDTDLYSYEKEQLKESLISKFDIDEDAADKLISENEYGIEEILADRDTSTPIEDLLRNTGRKTMFYDTGYEVPPDSWSWNEKLLTKERQVVKKKLGLRKLTPEQDHLLDMMIRQASYGGKLVIYFYENPGDFFNVDDIKTIRFSGSSPHMAIINTDNGSGDSCDIGRVEIKLPFNKENLFICKTFKYSYTHSVCGMFSNWCESTDVHLEKKKLRSTRKVENSDLSVSLRLDRKRTQVFQDGGCTPGDMDISRHRNVTYINNYPCGNKCPTCGTFWID